MSERAALGGYEVLYQLKSGGMGQVLLGRRHGPSGFERLVALKTIRRELRGHDHLRRMFFDEAQLLARLSHPGIAQIFDFGEDGETLYLAMEYVAGVSFRDLGELAPSPAVSARAMAEVCRALHAAHELTDLSGQALGVVHRDVSPDNLMLSFDGQVKVLDFGIALMRGRQAPVTAYDTIKGKPPYLSPEQIKSSGVDRRTDVFGAAVVLHELLTGEQLFRGDSVYAIARAIEHDDVPPPSVLAPGVPPELDAAVLRGLVRDPDGRWQTAAEMARALEAVAVEEGGEGLTEFATRALGDAREEHREWLRGVVAGTGERGRKAGRPSGVMTAAAAASSVAGAAGEARAEVLPAQGEGGGRWAIRIVGLATGAVALVGLGLFLWSSREQDQVAVVAAMDAAPIARIDGPAAPNRVPPVPMSMDASPEVVATTEPAVPPPRRRARQRSRGGPRGTVAVPVRESETAGAPVAGNGTITIAASPYAIVRVDGKELGPTPILRRQIPAGGHQVELLDPDTYKVRLRRSIQVEAGKHVDVKAL